MANTTKLASAFSAKRVILALRPEKLGGAIKRFRRLGLTPDLCGYDDFDGKNPDVIKVRVYVPVGSMAAFVCEAMEVGAELIDSKEVYLLCPVKNGHKHSSDNDEWRGDTIENRL